MIQLQRPHFHWAHVHWPHLHKSELFAAYNADERKNFSNSTKNISAPTLLIVTYLIVALLIILAWPFVMQFVQGGSILEDGALERVKHISPEVPKLNALETTEHETATTGNFDRASARFERGGMPTYNSKDETASLLIYYLLIQLPRNS